MLYIDAKLSMPVSEEEKKELKERLEKAVYVLGKQPMYFMFGIEDKYELYMAGNRLEKGAFVSVSVFKGVSFMACRRMTMDISTIFKEVLGIPVKSVYVTFQELSSWGWNAEMF
ncbi:MAG: 4-oxalocrotonate tautomerase family protein [Lachnospiraceae bacterium]